MSKFTQEIATTLVLRTDWSGVNLRYCVEVETKSETYHCFTTENYNQALVATKSIFDKMIKNKSEIGDFAVMIDKNKGQGISYDINAFSYDVDFSDHASFYQDLVNDFEYRKFADNIDANTLFRTFVDEYKLNEYQEQMFLKYIKEFKRDQEEG